MYNFVCLPSLVLSQICRRAGAAPKNIQYSSGVGSRRELQTCSVAFNTGVYILHFLCKRGQKLSDTQKGGGGITTPPPPNKKEEEGTGKTFDVKYSPRLNKWTWKY